MLATSKRIRFTLDEYLRMSEAGVFRDIRVELIEGRIHRMNARAHPHRWAVSKATRVLQSLFPADQFWVVVQGTLTLGKHNAPDPDFHVFAVPEGTAEAKLPRPFLVIEISDTTYRHDSGVKLRRYAQAGIEDYWIVNLAHRRVEVYRRPHNPTGKRSGWAYESQEHFQPGQKIKLLALPKLEIAVNDIVP